MSAMHCFHCSGDCLPDRCERGLIDQRDDMQPRISSGWSAMGPAPRQNPRRRRWWWTR